MYLTKSCYLCHCSRFLHSWCGKYSQGLASGTPFSLSHLFRQTGPFRPRNAPRNIPGLFFAGMGTTPGVGVPMVLISGNLAAQRVVSYLDAKAA